MTNNLVPKVSITEAAASLAVPQNNLVVIGIIGTSEKGTADQVYAISSVSQADAIFGSNYANGAYLVPMIKKAFQEGASYVKAVSVGQPITGNSAALTNITLAGSDTITADPTKFTIGDVVYLGTGNTYQFEERRVVLSKTSTTVKFTEPCTFKHYVGEIAQVVAERSSTSTAAKFQGKVAGMTTAVTITAVVAGSAGNITLPFHLTDTITTIIATRNGAHPSNTVTLTTGDGTQIPTADIVLVDGTDSSDFTKAINAMEEDEDKNIVVCEANDDTTATLMQTMCLNSYQNFNTPCVYFRGSELTDTEATVIANALAMNDSKAFMIYPLFTDFNGKTVSGGETAAAVAGAISGNGVPKLNHNFTEFTGFGGLTAKIANMDALIQAGVTPLELKYSSIHIVRFVTTKTLTDSIPDYTWQEGSIRLNVDFMEQAIARDLQQKFLQKGNTAQVRIAIETEVGVMLAKYASMDILVADALTNTPAYRKPVVSTDTSDKTKVNVDISVSPGKPLNFITLNFKVYL